MSAQTCDDITKPYLMFGSKLPTELRCESDPRCGAKVTLRGGSTLCCVCDADALSCDASRLLLLSLSAHSLYAVTPLVSALPVRCTLLFCHTLNVPVLSPLVCVDITFKQV